MIPLLGTRLCPDCSYKHELNSDSLSSATVSSANLTANNASMVGYTPFCTGRAAHFGRKGWYGDKNFARRAATKICITPDCNSEAARRTYDSAASPPRTGSLSLARL
eukprot:1305895-Amphidinium_carterae.3